MTYELIDPFLQETVAPMTCLLKLALKFLQGDRENILNRFILQRG